MTTHLALVKGHIVGLVDKFLTDRQNAHMTTRADVVSAMEAEREKWEQTRAEMRQERSQTLRTLTKVLGSSISELARETGIPRATVSNRLNGSTSIDRDEMLGFSMVLGVPVDVLEMNREDALRWVADNPANINRNRCFAITAQVAA